MENTKELYEKLHALWCEFETNHGIVANKGTKVAAGRARKALGEIKNLITPYRKASVDENK